MNVLHGGDVRGAAMWFETALDAARTGGHPDVRISAEAGVAECAAARGLVLDAERLLASVMGRCEERRDLRGYARALGPWSEAVRRQGRFSEALETLRARVPELRFGPSPGLFASLLLAQAHCEADLFRLGRAQECVDELLAILGRGQYLRLRLEGTLLNGRIQLASGHVGRAAWILEGVVDQAERAELKPLACRARAALGEARSGAGRIDEANQLFQGALRGLAGTSHRLAMADACLARVRAERGAANPAPTLQLVRDLVHDPRMAPAYVEALLAEYRYRVRTDDRAALQTAREAAAALNRIATAQTSTARRCAFTRGRASSSEA